MTEKGLNPEAASRIQEELKSSEEYKANSASIINAADKLSKNLLVDSATGCYNRNFWENFSENEFDSERGQEPTIVFCDLNGLKKINDEQGHEAGNEYLKRTADFLKKSFRKEDRVIRYGGDEFIVLCPVVKDLELFIEKINQNFSEEKLKENQVNFAFGIARFNKEIDEGGLKETIKRADTLMYKKKAEQKTRKNN